MKTNSTYQEILLMMDSSFASRDRVPKDEAKSKNLTPREKLQDACWNGLIPEFLPEIAEKKYDPTLSLLEINEGNHFLDVRYGADFEETDSYCSINPYLFFEDLELS